MEEVETVNTGGAAPDAQTTEQELQDKPLPITIDEEAETYVRQVYATHGTNIDESSPEYQNMLEQTKVKVTQSRVLYKNALERAKAQLAHMTVHHMKISTPKIGGLRNPIIITMGGFALMRDKGWLFEPTQAQMLSSVRRFPSAKLASKVGDQVKRELLKTCEVDKNKGTFIKEGWKDKLLASIEEELRMNPV